MIVAAHQPNFLPWLGFFHKMMKADLFVLVDHVQFERQNYQNRTRIKAPDGPRWITVPVRQGSRSERIVDKLVDNSRDGRHRWGRTMALTIQHSYRSAAFYGCHAAFLSEVFESRWERLVDLNIRLIEFCRDALDIRTPIIRSSELDIAGAKSDMVLDLCRKVGADVYLSGDGGSKGYLDAETFGAAGVRIEWQGFSHPRYAQVPTGGEFVDRLSALDLLLNCGPRSGDILRGSVPEAVCA